MKTLYQCAKIAQSLQHETIIRIGLIMFLFQSLNVYNFSATAKNWRTNYSFFFKPT